MHVKLADMDECFMTINITPKLWYGIEVYE